MKNIFLDTSIFVKENFLEGSRMQELLKLAAQGEFQLLISRITINEITQQFKKQTRKATDAHNELMNEKFMAPLKNIHSEKEKLVKFSKLKILCEEFNARFEVSLSTSKAIIIEYPTVDVGPVFEKYFSSQFPFNSSDKKHEFPDAFAILSLEEWCKEHKKGCIVFSKDKDFLKTKSKRLRIEENYEEFLATTLKKLSPERVELVPILFEKNSHFIDEQVSIWVKEQLDDYTKYYQHTNYMDVHDIKVSMVTVMDKKFQITKIEDEYIETEVIVSVYYEVDLTIDDEEQSYYDDEEKEMHYYGTTIKKLKRDEDIPLVVVFFIESKDEFDETCEIVEYNNSKRLEIESDHRFYDM